MNRKILLLNLCLLALLASLGWMLRVRWLEARAKERAVLSQAPRHTELLPPPSPALPAPAVASEYQEVVAKTLFSKDRDPNVVMDKVKGEPVYLILAMDQDKVLRLKPQNLATGLPIKHLEAVT